jgi:hypothetical protein
MYIRGFNSPVAIFLFFSLHVMSCTFCNTTLFSLLSLVPGLPVLILILPSPCIPVLIVPSPCPTHIPVQIMKSHISCHTLPLHCIAILSKFAPTPSPHLYPTMSSLDSVPVPHLPVTDKAQVFNFLVMKLTLL